MSKFMQIDIRLIPVYGPGGFRSSFPNFARLLKDFAYTRVLEEEPSLYHLVDVLIRVHNDPGIPEMSKRAIIRMRERFEKVREEAREHLLARRLNELDQTLYRLEDLFEELEKEL